MKGGHFRIDNVQAATSVNSSESKGLYGSIIVYTENVDTYLAWTKYLPDGKPISNASKRDRDVVWMSTTQAGEVTSNNDGKFSLLERSSLSYNLILPLSEVYSITKHTPRFDTPYIVITMRDGVIHNPLFFSDGGIKTFFNNLGEFSVLTHSDTDSNVILINDFDDMLTRSQVSMHIPSGSGRAGSNSSSGDGSTSSSSPLGHHDASPDSLTNQFHNYKYNYQYYYGAGAEYLIRAADIATKSILRPLGITSRREYMASKNNNTQQNGGIGPPPVPVATSTQYKNSLKIVDPYPSKKNGKNIESYRRVPTPTHIHSGLGSFEIIRRDSLPQTKYKVDSKKILRRKPLSPTQWISSFNDKGQILLPKPLLEQIFYGGIDVSIRAEVWKYLLGYYPWNSTVEEREEIVKAKKVAYEAIKTQWTTISPEQESHFEKFRHRRHGIEKDVIRTDRTHELFKEEGSKHMVMLQELLVTFTFFWFDLGYVQGMNELLSPILINIKSEDTTFWCYKHVMDRMAKNFNKDQIGIHTQLTQLKHLLERLDGPFYKYLESHDCTNMFFCYRWILIAFKREFSREEIFFLWEVLWSDYLTEHFHLFLALAILISQRDIIMTGEMQFDEILGHVTSLSGSLDLQLYLKLATELFFVYTDTTDDEVKTMIGVK